MSKTARFMVLLTEVHSFTMNFISPFLTMIFMFFIGVRYLFPILFPQSFTISSILTFSIPASVFVSSLIVYSITLLFITNSRLLNFFRFKVICLFFGSWFTLWSGSSGRPPPYIHFFIFLFCYFV